MTLKILKLPGATLVLLHQRIIFLPRTGALDLRVYLWIKRKGTLSIFVCFDLSYWKIAVDHDLIVFLISILFCVNTKLSLGPLGTEAEYIKIAKKKQKKTRRIIKFSTLFWKDK